MFKKFLFLIGTLLLVFWQLSFWNTFERPGHYLNLVLFVAVFITVAGGYQPGAIFGIISGFLLDLYSPLGFGTYTTTLFFSVLVVSLLFRRLLARKTIYAFLLVLAVSTIIYHAVSWLYSNMTYWIGWSELTIPFNKYFIIYAGGQVAIHLILALLVFFMIRFISGKLRTNFIFN